VAWWCSAHSAHSLTHSHTHVCLSLFHSLIQFSALHCECTQDSDQATSDTTAEAERAAPWSERRASRTHSLTHSLSHAPQAPAAGRRSAGSNPSITTPPPRTCHSLTHSLKHPVWKCATNTRRLTTTNSAPPHHHSLTRLLLHLHFHFHPHFHHSGPP
jgi:hypothetical protein